MKKSILYIVLVTLILHVSFAAFAGDDKSKDEVHYTRGLHLTVGAGVYSLPQMIIPLSNAVGKSDILDNSSDYKTSTSYPVQLGLELPILSSFSIAAVGSYQKSDLMVSYNDNTKKDYNYQLFTAMLRGRFYYFKFLPFIDCYSGLSLGYGYATYKDEAEGVSKEKYGQFAFHADLFGVRIGGKRMRLSGFADVGIGAYGVFNAGLAYKL